jgi:GNAT superfamily N-acetyltransferase
MSQYFAELDQRFPEGFDVAGALAEAPHTLASPYGAFVLAGPVDAPVACGAIHFIDDERGEIKRMWVAPSHRGQGLATRMLGYLEDLIRDSGRSSVVLDTNRALTNAVALYERQGYTAIERYNDNPYAHHWFGKALAPSD